MSSFVVGIYLSLNHLLHEYSAQQSVCFVIVNHLRSKGIPHTP